MACDRVRRTPGWTQAPNTLMRDGGIRAVSKVIYVLLAGFSDEFDFSRRTLEKMTGSSRDTVQNALRELEERGYLIRHKERNGQGQWAYTYELLGESPVQESPVPENTVVERPEPDLPVPVEPVPDLPVPENPVLLRRTLSTRTLKEEHLEAVRASATAPPSVHDFDWAVESLIDLFAASNKRIDREFAARLLTDNAKDGASFIDTLRLAQEVLERVPRANTNTVAEYIFEGLPGLLRLRATLSVGRNTYQRPDDEPIGREAALAQLHRVKSVLEAR